ncbi:MAG TPA: hypothetical protein VFB62_20990 [Polyangiaceae bacterium]|nr:hypothetical protein [Polyangiaceae bacterium]
MLTPFDYEHADPWGSHFLDLETLNAHVNGRIAELLLDVRGAAERSEREALRTSALLVLGPAGTGKTHLFSRLRRELGPRAAFVHIRPDIGVVTTPRHVLAHVIDALTRETARQPARQLEVVLGCLISAARGGQGARPLLHLDDHRRAPDAERAETVEGIVDRVEGFCFDLSIDYLELLLTLPVLSRIDQRAALAWLSGREPSEAQLARLGRRAGLGDTEVIPALRTLAAVAAFGAPLVLVFDQLENLVDPNGETDRIIAYGTLISELRDNARGLTLVQMALDTEWMHGIRSVLGSSQRTRVEGEIVQVSMPTREEREKLVKLWVAALPDEQRSAPFPAPFTGDQVKRWCDAADMTPRALMIACRQALAGALERARKHPEVTRERQPPSEPPPRENDSDALSLRLEALWEEYLAAARNELKRESEEGRSVSGERLAGALVAAAGLLDDTRALARMQGTAVAVMLERAQSRIAVIIAQQLHPRSLAVSLRRAAERAATEPVLVVRDQALPFKPSWGGCEEQRRQLLKSRFGSWLELARHELVRLLATHDFLAAARSQDLAGPDGHAIDVSLVRKWLADKNEITQSGVLPLALAMLTGTRPSERPPSAPPLRTSTAPLPQPEPLTRAGAVAILRELRIASIERLVREVRARHRHASRAAIEAELRSAGGRIRWFGSSIVCLEERDS